MDDGEEEEVDTISDREEIALDQADSIENAGMASSENQEDIDKKSSNL